MLWVLTPRPTEFDTDLNRCHLNKILNRKTRRVKRDYSQDLELTMHVREFSPMKESLRTWVSLLALNGVWALLRPRALIHSWNTDRDRCRWRSSSFTFKINLPGSSQVTLRTFRANRLLLISAPSRRVWRSALEVSAPLSFPARSIRENLPCILSFRRRIIWNTAWLRDEWALADVCPDVLDRTKESTDRKWTRCLL